MPKIAEGISLNQLKEGAVFEINPSDPIEDLDSDLEEEEKVKEAMLQFSNLNCLGTDDNTSYDEEPFETIAKGMVDVTSDGGVKKRIIRKGYGSKPDDLSLVKIDYNAYVEYEAEPFDSTYSRNKRQEFTLNNGEVIRGLDEAVKTMLITEKSQFIIKPEYAYGPMGCLGRVPPNATILFEIELQEVVNSGATIQFEKLTPEEKNNFQAVYPYCLSLCERAKDKFQKKKTKEALKDYNLAVSKLEYVFLEDFAQQEKQQELLLRVLGNVLVCYTILENPRRGCSAANKIYNICKGTTLKVSAKTYFSHAKCLRMLGEYSEAKKKLEQARKLEPKNIDITNEFILLKDEEEKYKKKQLRMSEGLLKSISDPK